MRKKSIEIMEKFAEYSLPGAYLSCHAEPVEAFFAKTLRQAQCDAQFSISGQRLTHHQSKEV